MKIVPARTTTSRMAIIGALLVLVTFVLVFAAALAALQRIDEVYQSTERTVNRAMRAVLKGDGPDLNMVTEMRDLFGALERLERIAVSIDLHASSAGLRDSFKAYTDDLIGYDEIVDRFLKSFDRLEQRIEEKRLSISRSFYALIAALALSLVMAIIVASVLSYRLGVSRLEAEWSQRSLKRTLAAEETLRRRIANDLHDNAAQDIAAARMLCERSATGYRNGDTAAAADRSLEASGLLASAGRMIRGLALDLRPPELERSDLVSALESLCSRSHDERGRRALFRHDCNPPLMNDEAAIQVYRIVQEALANARKHAGPHGVEVRLSRAGHDGATDLLVTVRDYPDGYPPEGSPDGKKPGTVDMSMSSGLGMAIMRERAALAGGYLSVETEESGITVKLVIPTLVI